MGFKPREDGLRAGLLYGVELGNGSWGAVQSLADGRLVALDWFGASCPSVAALSGRDALVHDHHNWQPAALVFQPSEDWPIPATFVRLGDALAPITTLDGETRGEALVDHPLQLRLQHRWSQFPADVRDGYKPARKNREELEIAPTPGVPAVTVEARATEFHVVGDADWSTLNVLPALTEITYEGDDLGFIDYVNTRPLVSTIVWSSENLDSLDLSGTRLATVAIGDMPRLRELRLPATCDDVRLKWVGPLALSHPGGRFDLAIRSPSPTAFTELTGAANVSRLELKGGEHVDCAHLVRFANLVNLLFRDVRQVSSVDALTKLGSLATLEMYDCYDFDGASMPVPADWPNMRWQSMSGLRKRDAVELKRRAGNDKRLEVRGAKTDAWLAANFNNPFRDWPDYHSGRKAKKAVKAYQVAVKAIDRAAGDADAVLRQFVAVFNTMDSGEGIDTVDREQIFDAFMGLADRAGLDGDRYAQQFDAWRDF